MSLFRKPKKIQRRVFSSTVDDEDVPNESSNGGVGVDVEMIEDDEMIPPPPPSISIDRSSKKDKNKKSCKTDANDMKSTKAKCLLSFADDEEDAEVFQVRKSSHSKKMMRMMDKERRKKRREEKELASFEQRTENGRSSNNNNNNSHNSRNSSNNYGNHIGSTNHTSSNKNKNSTASSTTSSSTNYATAAAVEQCKSNKSDNIQTEIRTDDFVLVVKKSEPPDVILNGRAAFCAGRNDISDDDGESVDDEQGAQDGRHRFSKPEHLKQMLESGSIPDAAMIHAARKRRQKAREQGDFIPVDEPKDPPKKGSRLAREDVEGDQSDDEERVDMNAITGIKEREERREQFYAVENDSSEEDSDRETHEWENQQIRKGVTGAQLVNAQHETVLSRFMIKSSASANLLEYDLSQSTSTLLEQAYAKSALEKPKQLPATAINSKKEKPKAAVLRTPQQIREAIRTRLTSIKELNDKHTADIARIAGELKLLKIEELDCKQRAPSAAAKYRFYQEIKCYVNDLVECLDEKTPLINDMEKRSMQLYAKHQNFLIERRRQDVRDQAKEMAEALKPSTSAAARHNTDTEDQIRRAAEREGRRTRRRCDRERNELSGSHLDGMSSDDETYDYYQEQFQSSLAQIQKDELRIFSDVTDEFCRVDMILIKFFAWRKTDMESYKDAFVSLCLPKILGPLVRSEMLLWSPLLDDYKDIENLNWYTASMLYAWSEHETIESLKQDPDFNLVPSLIEKIVLPKLTELVKKCWDPLSTTQTLRLIGFINRLGRDFPLKSTSKPLKQLFDGILERMHLALENDVFIPIFPKQVQEAKTSFFQRQFCSGLKLFRNFISWQGIIADSSLRELSIEALLNRYLLLAMRVCTPNDAINKAYIVVNTLPTVWLLSDSETLKSLELLTAYIRQTLDNCDAKNPLFIQSCDKAKQILQRLHSF